METALGRSLKKHRSPEKYEYERKGDESNEPLDEDNIPSVKLLCECLKCCALLLACPRIKRIMYEEKGYANSDGRGLSNARRWKGTRLSLPAEVKNLLRAKTYKENLYILLARLKEIPRAIILRAER